MEGCNFLYPACSASQRHEPVRAIARQLRNDSSNGPLRINRTTYVNAATSDVFILLWNDSAWSNDHRLFRTQSLSAGDLLQVAGNNCELNFVGGIMIAKGLRNK